jgi:hypothetical protein
MDQSELPDQISRLEQRIEELSASVEKSRKAIVVSKLSLAAGGLLTLALVFGLIGGDPLPIVVAIAAIFGGIVGFGANVSTARQDTSAMNEAEALRAELIGKLELREIANEPAISFITRH